MEPLVGYCTSFSGAQRGHAVLPNNVSATRELTPDCCSRHAWGKSSTPPLLGCGASVQENNGQEEKVGLQLEMDRDTAFATSA